MIFSDDLIEDLWNGESAVCFFVNNRECYWLIDKKYNICLDGEKEYQAYLNKGYITKEQYDKACRDFRNGILKLNSENFMNYVDLDHVRNFSVDIFNNEVVLDYALCKKVENYLVYGDELSKEDFLLSQKIVCLLPLFYINFDRKLFMHMDWGRNHEDTIYESWSGSCGDFLSLIPDDQKYWIHQRKDFWKFKNI
ncbi:hypothetical protein [Photobacterium galatheae]|uniref:Uncharacterized protein n=1 Tax=Photobacterium galatheae TaxID=1654360 RepID=A0A066RLQ8_9GAMM|nr:hypothetical protein [Photobacterium galatheae]KDM90061.1 hypothetical protein EA58_19190 [Photobacterium galatheae]MCM0150042.1 hypothetical protein [Photobacterium galatheae]